jgi:penicillin-binding protein 1C
MWKHLNKWKRRHWMLLGAASLAGLLLLVPPRKPLFQDDYSVILRSGDGKLLHAYINSSEQWHFPPDTGSIPEKLRIAVIQFEDEGFYRHFGISFKAIVRAAYQNARQGRITSGASTIPMQIARMSNPKPRTYFNKFREASLAVRLSLYYSKENLLRLYLDHAPYGGNVIGYRTASLKFFGKEASELTWSEAATLAVLPNAPGLIYPSGSSSSLRQKRDLLLLKLFEKGYIGEQTLQLATLEPVPDQFLVFDSHAPHLARYLRAMNPGEKILKTTIRSELQKQCNQIAAHYRERYKPLGIHNLAILVADTKTGAIRAYVGSSDFFDFEHSGQVDGARAPRSSGSILKPFLYALSMDEGLIIPDTYIRDLPTFFDGFSPKNASREYQGVVPARDALIQSLNIPAVRLLNAYGLFQFHSFLKEAGVSTLFRTADEYGLPLILGGGEVSLWDMVMLYRGLANEGIFSSNTLLTGEQSRQAGHLISEGSSYLTLDILRDLKRPGSEYFWQKFSGSRPFAWKTGTSYGHKDAWAVGVNPEYTIGVWVGNFDGASNKNLGGASSAGPILFDILQSLPHEHPRQWFEKADIYFKELTICSLSGFRATDACSDTKSVQVPFGMKPLQACEYHQHRFFSKDGKHQTCSRCWEDAGGIQKSVPIYPPDVAYYLREKGQYIEPLPAHNPECPAYRAENSVRIIYPNMDAKLFLPRDFDGTIQNVICRAGHSNTGVSVYWYLDDSYLGMTYNEHKLGIRFREGWNSLKVIDEHGSENSVRVFATLRSGGEQQ